MECQNSDHEYRKAAAEKMNAARKSLTDYYDNKK